MLLGICASTIILSSIILIAYVLKFSKPFSISKKTVGSSASLVLHAKKRMQRIELSLKDSGESISFVRSGITPGQDIEFIYPVSATSGKLIIEFGSGKKTLIDI